VLCLGGFNCFANPHPVSFLRACDINRHLKTHFRVAHFSISLHLVSRRATAVDNILYHYSRHNRIRFIGYFPQSFVPPLSVLGNNQVIQYLPKFLGIKTVKWHVSASIKQAIPPFSVPQPMGVERKCGYLPEGFRFHIFLYPTTLDYSTLPLSALHQQSQTEPEESHFTSCNYFTIAHLHYAPFP